MIKELKQRCALMNCELEPEDLCLGDIIKKFPKKQCAYQAKLLISNHGFKESDILCIDCFWK